MLVELGREIRAECHDEEGDAQQGVHQVQHRQEPEIHNQIVGIQHFHNQKIQVKCNAVLFSGTNKILLLLWPC